MTLEQCLSLAREIRHLDLLHKALTAMVGTPGAALVWPAAVVAIDDRLRWCRYVAGLEPPVMMATAAEMLHAEIINTPSDDPSRPVPLVAVDGPRSSRIH